MDTLEQIEATLIGAANLMDLARSIVNGPPYFVYVTSGPICLDIDGDEAVIGWYDDDTYRDFRFPANMLLMSLADIKAWKKSEKEKYDEKEKAQRAARDEQETEREMMILHDLMVKYSVKPAP